MINKIVTFCQQTFNTKLSRIVSIHHPKLTKDQSKKRVFPTITNPSTYLATGGCGSSTLGHLLARTGSSHTLKSRDPSHVKHLPPSKTTALP